MAPATLSLGRAVVRRVFKDNAVGALASCIVTLGVIECTAQVRVIRNGIVVYPAPDRTAEMDWLKGDTGDEPREMYQGYHCWIKIAGYDDVKVDDVIEAYRVEQVQRTL